MNNKSELISISDARNLILSKQLLLQNNKCKTKYDLLNLIDTLGYLQIDTISVVERSHHHILWSRMPTYKKEMLSELLEKDKLIFEYWSHAASFLPVTDYKFSLIRKNNIAKKYKSWGSANNRIIKRVFDRIKSEGPLQSKDFDDKRKSSSGWWDWKPSKDALDFLFHTGKLMVAKRNGFQKVYDLTERVLPECNGISIPSEKELYAHLIMKSLKSNGIVTEKEIMYLRRYDKSIFKKILDELREDNIIREVRINNSGNEVYFTTEDNLNNAENIKHKNIIHILSPFDNFVIQRKRLKEIFDFDYQIECYVPKPKRKFGYFVLPVLKGNKFIGRIDAKASRDTGTFRVINFFPEVNFQYSKSSGYNLIKKINSLSEFSGCSQVEGI